MLLLSPAWPLELFFRKYDKNRTDIQEKLYNTITPIVTSVSVMFINALKAIETDYNSPKKLDHFVSWFKV